MELCRCYNTAFIEIGMAGRIDDMGKIISEWVRCPVCGNKTRLQIRADTELKNFPLYCPKCRQESLIDVKDLQVTVIKREVD